MIIRKLDISEVTEIYRQHLIYDFPEDEQKPLKRILRMMDEGTYICYGLFDVEILKGYAFFLQLPEGILLDFLAIVSRFRGTGCGSEFLHQLKSAVPSDTCIIAEVEDPDAAADETDLQLRLRRMRFYDRSGFRNTDVRVSAFEVPFVLLEMSDTNADEQYLRMLYSKCYRYMLPEELYNKYVKA